MINVYLNNYCTGCDKFEPKLTSFELCRGIEFVSVNHTLTCEYKDTCDVIREALSKKEEEYWLEPLPDSEAIELCIQPYCHSCPSFDPSPYKVKNRESGKYSIGCKCSQDCSQIKEHLRAYNKSIKSKLEDYNHDRCNFK